MQYFVINQKQVPGKAKIIADACNGNNEECMSTPKTKATERNTEVASLLLMRGGDATARSRDGLSPLDIAKEKYNKDICELLENA